MVYSGQILLIGLAACSACLSGLGRQAGAGSPASCCAGEIAVWASSPQGGRDAAAGRLPGGSAVDQRTEGRLEGRTPSQHRRIAYVTAAGRSVLWSHDRRRPLPWAIRDSSCVVFALWFDVDLVCVHGSDQARSPLPPALSSAVLGRRRGRAQREPQCNQG